MKTAKSFLAAVLTLMLVCTMCVSAFAYNDVAAESESLAAIEFVDRLGIIQSTWGGDYKPDQYLTRADAITAVYRTLYGSDINADDYAEISVNFTDSTKGDVDSDSALAPYLAWAVDNYLLTDNLEDAKFYPSQAITANELITLLAKVLRLVEDSDAAYPDDYTSAIGEIAGGIEAGDTPVTREAAAVAFANAIMSANGEVVEMGVYEDFDGNALDSLAVNVFNMSTVDLVIRATKNRTLGYTVNNGTLLSNGADVDFGEDLSEYVGYGITLTFRDSDASGTYTEDEEILTYSVSSTTSSTVSLSSVSIQSGNTVSISTESGTFNIGTATYLYLNDEPWPIGDEKYDLVGLIPSIGVSTSITNRPNLKFKCMQAGSDIMLATVFATESRPGKIVGINNGYYTVYDYYYAGSKDEYRTYNVSDCNFTTTVKVGDYVNFYEAAGKIYFEEGSVIVSAVSDKSLDENTGEYDYTIAKDGGFFAKEHAFFMQGDTALDIKADGKGTQYNLIFDNSGENFIITWESIKANYAQLFINEINTDTAAKIHKIKALNLTTNKNVELEVKFENTDSPVPVVAGDYVTYYDNGAESNPEVFIKKNGYRTVDVSDIYDAGDYLEITVAGEKEVYYKSQYYNTDLSTLSGTVKLNLDMANCVVTVK